MPGQRPRPSTRLPTFAHAASEELARVRADRARREQAALNPVMAPTVVLPDEIPDPIGMEAALALARPNVTGGPWEPNPGPQSDALKSSVYEMLYGGAAGGGKSVALLFGGLRYIDRAEYRAIYLRRTFPELEGSIIPASKLWFPKLGGRYNESKHFWVFPSGAIYKFAHLEYEDSVDSHLSAEYQYLAFDELTTFTERQYVAMLARARSAAGIPIRIRAGSNPGSEGHDWVQKRWAPWLGVPPGEVWAGPTAEPFQTLWYINTEDDGEKYVTQEEAAQLLADWQAAPEQDRGLKYALPLSRVFIPARIQDNPKLVLNDPAYIQRLRGLDPVRRDQLLKGDWNARPEPGKFFNRAWFEFVDAAPTRARRRVRRWDLAGTEPEEAADHEPDWTVGVLLSIDHQGHLCIEDVQRGQWSPNEVEEQICATAALDGRGVEISLPQDPGQAGKFQSRYLISKLQGYRVSAKPETGSKEERAGPISSQAEGRNVSVVRAAWNLPFFRVLERFPKGKKDDVDALSGGYLHLVDNKPASYGGLATSHGSWGRKR
jgi:predicted phage terminase large subunit-like protein